MLLADVGVITNIPALYMILILVAGDNTSNGKHKKPHLIQVGFAVTNKAIEETKLRPVPY